MKSLASAALIAALGLSLSACGSTTDSSKPSASGTAAPISAPSSAPVPKATPTEDTKKSPRGNLIMAVGDTGTISDGASQKLTTKFTVNSIAPGECYEKYSRPAENGQILLVDITVETTPELANASYPKFSLSGHDFKFIAENGTTFNGSLSTMATYSCIADAEQFPSGGMGPAENITAKVVLDVPAATGILVLEHGYRGGFEYKF